MKWYEDEKQVRQVMRGFCRSTHQNAENLINNAILLMNNGSYGHAYALAVLSFEEWSKWWNGVFIFMGLLKYEEYLTSPRKNHPYKHISAIQILFILIYSEWFETSDKQEEVKELSMQFFKGEISEKKHTKFMISLLKQDNSREAANLLDAINQIEEFEINPRLLEKKRQRGLYVEIDRKNGGVFDPQQFRKPEVEPFINSMKEILNYTSERNEIILGKSKKEKELQKDIIMMGTTFRKMIEAFSKSPQE
ncbi:MAG: AbiV family abortive infection protein [Candidatus Heimdallarchaeota archaeon]